MTDQVTGADVPHMVWELCFCVTDDIIGLYTSIALSVSHIMVAVMSQGIRKLFSSIITLGDSSHM